MWFFGLRQVRRYCEELHRAGLVVLRLLAMALGLPDSEAFFAGARPHLPLCRFAQPNFFIIPC